MFIAAQIERLHERFVLRPGEHYERRFAGFPGHDQGLLGLCAEPVEQAVEVPAGFLEGQRSHVVFAEVHPVP